MLAFHFFTTDTSILKQVPCTDLINVRQSNDKNMSDSPAAGLMERDMRTKRHVRREAWEADTCTSPPEIPPFCETFFAVPQKCLCGESSKLLGLVAWVSGHCSNNERLHGHAGHSLVPLHPCGLVGVVSEPKLHQRQPHMHPATPIQCENNCLKRLLPWLN